VPNEPRIHFAPFTLDLVNECLWEGPRAIKLRPKAFAVLEHLLASPGELVTKERLITAVWQDTFVGDAVLKVAIRQVREALSDDARSPRFIETAHRRGYRFIGTIGGAVNALSDAARPAAEGAAIPGRRPLPEPPPGFVGRHSALSRMHAWLDKARRGDCQVVFVTGEAGIGKTTLLETFTRDIESDPAVRVCSGQCLEQYGMGEAYLPVFDAMRQLCRDDAEVGAVLRLHAPMWLMQMPSLVTPADRESFGRDAPAVTRERMLREMGDALDALTAHFTLVLVLEDLHWSDFSTLDLISYVARRRRAARLMIAGTYRPSDLMVSRHPLRMVKQELVARQQGDELPLEYLTKEAVGEHLAIRFTANQFPPDLAALIHQRTEGNPLFMVNTIDYLVAEGLIAPHEQGWRVTAPLAAIGLGVPESIRQLIEAQVDCLDAGDQRILEAASVAGTEFSAAAVSAALNDDLRDIQSRCEHLSRRHHFLKECGAQLLPNGDAVGRFAFVHGVYRHVLYERISAARRIQLHWDVAFRGEELYGERANEIAAELAMHYEEAADYARAVRHLHQAAVNALRRSAYREAIALSRKGLGLLAMLPDTEERARHELWLKITLVVPLMATEGYAAPEVGSVYTEARQLGDRVGTPSELSQVLWGLWTFHLLKAELATGFDIASEFLRLAERVEDPAVAMRGHWAMQITRTHQGSFRVALDHFEKAMSRYDPEQHVDDPFAEALNPVVAMRGFAAWSLWFMGQPDRAVAGIGEAVALARRLSEPHGLTHALVFAGVLHQLRGERQIAQQYADAAIALAAEHGLIFYGSMARIVRGWALIGSGDDDRAGEEIRDGMTGWQSTGAQLLRPHFLGLLAEALAPAAGVDRGLAVLDEALAVADSTGERCYQAELYRLRGERLLAHADADDARGAEACFEQALAIARAQEALSLELRATMSLARLRRRRNSRSPVRDLVLPVYERFTEGFDTVDLREARALLNLH
jgi:predicted ATPase/DNA-binding winged helix-turn-helix (wHTH) protein